jgi:hypothetical protein
MRTIGLLLLAGALLAQAPPSASPSPQAVGTMSQLMVDYIYPTSDVIFYVYRLDPNSERDWIYLQQNALMLGEAGNLLMTPQRARDQEQWMKDAKLLVDVGAAAYKLSKAKDMEGLKALNDQLYAACQTCHEHYRIRRRPPAAK